MKTWHIAVGSMRRPKLKVVGIRDGQGAWGVLFRNLNSRQGSFRLAVVVAFAPFCNAKLYRASAAAKG